MKDQNKDWKNRRKKNPQNNINRPKKVEKLHPSKPLQLPEYRRTILERIQVGEFSNPCSPEIDPAVEIFNQQIHNLYTFAEALTRARNAIPPKPFSSDYLVCEVDRKARFRSAVEKNFKMENHPKAELIWNRAWILGEGDDDRLEQVFLIYATLMPLVR